MIASADSRKGLFYGIAANLLWGALPLYLNLLKDVDALQILSHRVVWSLAMFGAIIAVSGRVRTLMGAARGRTLGLLAISAALIAVNWFVYIWSAANGHLVEASLGYFITPLVNVALGTLLLRERLARSQAVAIGIVGIGVMSLAVSGGGEIWISLSLALSFGFYGVIRKIVAIDALGGLTIETSLLAPLALLLLFYVGSTGKSAMGQDIRIDALLIVAGPITALPLLLFAAGARRLRYTTLGLLQFIAPTLLLAQAIFLYQEPIRASQLATFGLIWIGCGLYAWGSIISSRNLIVQA
ncbi:EamA family transporter RarD [Xanthomonas campestris]|uniref:EamA family transporter RarD n=1 Tax=Xanthomonas campestris TaxID=339 RepID=UPI001930E878|nr:EamA family transporter RarD [Xanthomonas campestris]MCC5067089.1 EamA family transporter RarD [Xanthomonas campestris]MCC5087098.1 EamA family transporter RarD [Xanthomonas campestris]MEB2230956.1 EamA family transporter RarD [Xanthomonas campestris pv. campestris]